MSNVWAVDDPPTPRDALARYGGAWSADSSTHTAVSELVASLRLAVDDIDRLQRELAEARAYISTIIEGDDDAESKAETIVAMIERRDRHIAKLAGIGVDQEGEIAELRRRIEALEARPVAPVIVPSHPWPQPTYPQIVPFGPYYPTITNGGTTCQSKPSMTV